MTGKKGQIGFPGSKGEKGAQGPPGKVGKTTKIKALCQLNFESPQCSTAPKSQTLKVSSALFKTKRKKSWKKRMEENITKCTIKYFTSTATSDFYASQT